MLDINQKNWPMAGCASQESKKLPWLPYDSPAAKNLGFSVGVYNISHQYITIIEYMFIIVFVHTLHCYTAPHYIVLNMYYIYIYIVYMYIVYIDYCPLWIIGMHIQVVDSSTIARYFLQWQWWTGQALVTGADRSLIQTEVVKDAWLPNKR